MADAPPAEFVVYFVGFLLTAEAVRAVRSPRTRVIWRGLRLRHAVPALHIIPLVLAAYLAIAHLAPWTQWGWWSALGGHGNVVLGSTSPGSNDPVSPVLRIAPFVFLAAVLCFLPAAARLEERWFRRGTERRAPPARALAALAFGLVHVVMGVPIAVALALSLAGAGFQQVYLAGYARRASRHDALMASTHAHLAYNLILLSVVAAGLAASILR